MTFVAIIVAAGSGTRAGAESPKHLRPLGGKPVIRWSVEALSAAGAQSLVIVGRPQDFPLIEQSLVGLSEWQLIPGGPTRSASVQAGLASLAIADDTPILIHDAARPLLTLAIVERLLEALLTSDAAVPVLAVTDTIKSPSEVNSGEVATLDRNKLWRAQTPQASRLGMLRRAYAQWTRDGDPTDDAEVISAAGGNVSLIAGSERLLKLTYPEDFAVAETHLGTRWETRTGQGVDAHRWGPGQSTWLCGVEICYDHALIGHSDADAGLHALTDALLGALGAGDIGDHFPPTDPQWRGAPSRIFLEHAARLLEERGGRLVNLDVTLVCEAPKIKPHRHRMRQALAEILSIDLERVSVKATTTEGMGFAGRREGLLALASVSIECPVHLA
jgi:2-C-methyl-D-erythritol 4-phosphate cytidylyltransferase/2-C-methyl-D-erythritol 2,4-cyclodiphosphate synthase